MGRMARWFQSAVQVFRACVGRNSAQIDVQKEKTTKKKRSYRLWVFRIKRKDRSCTQTVSCPQATTSAAAATPTESTRDGSKVAGSSTKKPVHGNTASRRVREEVVKRKCGVSSTTRGNQEPGKQHSVHTKNSKSHLSAKTCGRKTPVQAANMVRLPVFGPLEKDATPTLDGPAKNNSPGLSETRQVGPKVSNERKGTTAEYQPTSRMRGRSPHQLASKPVLGKTVRIPPARHAQKRIGEKPVDMPEAKLKKRNTPHQVSTCHIPAVVHETPVDTPLKSVLKRLDADLNPGCSQVKEVTFGEKVQVKVYKVKAAGRLNSGQRQASYLTRTSTTEDRSQQQHQFQDEPTKKSLILREDKYHSPHPATALQQQQF